MHTQMHVRIHRHIPISPPSLPLPLSHTYACMRTHAENYRAAPALRNTADTQSLTHSCILLPRHRHCRIHCHTAHTHTHALPHVCKVQTVVPLVCEHVVVHVSAPLSVCACICVNKCGCACMCVCVCHVLYEGVCISAMHVYAMAAAPWSGPVVQYIMCNAQQWQHNVAAVAKQLSGFLSATTYWQYIAR